MTPNPETRLVTLPEVITGTLVRKFGEISLYNQHADFELGSASNSNSTSPWAITCEPATETSCEDAPLHEHFPYGLCNASRAHAEALAARRVGKEIDSGYSMDSNPASGYYSDSSYEFNFGSDPVEPEFEVITTEQPLSGPATRLVITSTPAGIFVYWTDRKPADLTHSNSRCVAYLDPTATSTTSQKTSYLQMRPLMKLTTTRMPDVNATECETNIADVSVKLSQSGISSRLLIKSPTGCTLPRTLPHVYHYDNTSGSGDTRGQSNRQAS
jgi:hypothetical protein